MKSVTPDPLIVKLARNGVVVSDLVVVAMKGGVEAGDLRQSREIGEQRTNRNNLAGWFSCV